MTADDLIALLQALPPEQRKLPVYWPETSNGYAVEVVAVLVRPIRAGREDLGRQSLPARVEVLPWVPDFDIDAVDAEIDAPDPEQLATARGSLEVASSPPAASAWDPRAIQVGDECGWVDRTKPGPGGLFPDEIHGDGRVKLGDGAWCRLEELRLVSKRMPSER